MIVQHFRIDLTPLRSMRESTGTSGISIFSRRSTALCVFADPATFSDATAGDIRIFGGVTSGLFEGNLVKVS